MTRQPDRRPWSVEDIRDILAGTLDDGEAADRLRTADRKGLFPVTFAAMKAATTGETLLPLLTLLEPPSKTEKSRLDLILDLLERIAEGQIALSNRMDALESTIRKHSATLPAGLPTATVRRVSGR